MVEDYENTAVTNDPAPQGRQAFTDEFLEERETDPQPQSGEGLGLPIVNFSGQSQEGPEQASQQGDAKPGTAQSAPQRDAAAGQQQPPEQQTQSESQQAPGKAKASDTDPLAGADDEPQERTVTEEKTLSGGTKYKKYSDDSQRFEYSDGTAYEKHADHETHINKNGDAIENYDNGKTRVVYKNGNIVTTTRDGDVHLEKPDGETLLWQRNGNVLQTKDGNATSWESDGTVSQLFNDSSSITWDKNGEISLSVDGNTTSTFRSDGTVSHLHTEEWTDDIGGTKVSLGTKFSKIEERPDGSMQFSMGVESPDGNTTNETDPITLKRSDEADGTAVLRSDDGTIEMRRSPDGSVRQIMREGESTMETTYSPNGEMFHREGNSTIQRFLDGTIEMQNQPDTDAKSIRIDPSGATTYVFEDGTQKTVDVKGRVTTVSPDGKVENTRIEVETADGRTLYPDFSTAQAKVMLTDGTMATIEKDDDDYILVKPDGTKSRLSVDSTNSALFDDVFLAKNTAEQARTKDPPKAVQVMRRIP